MNRVGPPLLKQRTSYFPTIQAIGIVMLAWALVPSNPYGYYILLRIVICAICIFLTIRAAEYEREGWAWTLGVLAFVYNPIFPVHLTREVWSVVNVLTIAIFVWTIWANRERSDMTED